MNNDTSIEIKILQNLPEEMKKFISKSKDSLILQWFSSKSIESPIISHDTFMYDVIFIGKKNNPKYSGYGLIIYPSEIEYTKCYIGSFKRGRRHGFGCRRVNDTIFTGNYKRDMKHGPAKILKISNNDFEKIFDGAYVDGKMQGKCFIKDSEHTFNGYVDQGKYHGLCKIKYTNGNIFEGSMIKGTISGKGKITYTNGDVYEGGFLENKCSGEGNYSWAQGTFNTNLSSNLSITKTSDSGNLQNKKIDNINKWANTKKINKLDRN